MGYYCDEPAERAKRTAEIINEYLHLPIVEMDDFKERDYGDAEGMLLEERTKRYPDKNYPNMETLEELTDRLMGGLVKVNQAYPNKKVLIVAHGAAIHALLTEISGVTQSYKARASSTPASATLNSQKRNGGLKTIISIATYPALSNKKKTGVRLSFLYFFSAGITF